MKVLDLCCGLGGATAAFRDRGHEVVGVDIDPVFEPDVVADVRLLDPRTLPITTYDFVWASPPCDGFARVSMPWFDDVEPDMSIVDACIGVIDLLGPRWWVIENTRGSVPFISKRLPDVQRVLYRSHYLWGKYPIMNPEGPKRGKSHMSSKRKVERAMIPHELSLAMCLAMETEV